MGDENTQTIAELTEENATLRSELSQMDGQISGLKADLQALDEKTGAAINRLSDTLLKLHGKDGIKVTLPIISLERDFGAALDALTPTVALDVNLIVNGTATVISDATNELPDEEAP